MKSFSYTLRYLLFVVIMFCAIFTPDFFSFSIRYILVIICGTYLLWNVLITGKIKLNIRFIGMINGFIPFISYYIAYQIIFSLIDLANASAHISALIHTLISFIGAFIISGFMVCVCRKLDLTYKSFLNVILIVMLAQFICVILALTVPSVRYAFNSLIIMNSYSDRLAELAEASNRGFTNRAYGLSNNLFDSFGYITAVLILLLYNKGMDEKNNKYIFIAIIMSIMPLVNARTGILLLILGFIVINLFYLDLTNFFKILFIVLIVLISFFQIIQFLPQSMLEWLASGISDISSLLSGSKSEGVFSEILGEDLVFPNSVIVGAGLSPASFGYTGIDNGYVNCLWNFGLIGSILLFMGYIHLFWKVYCKDNAKYYKSISIILATLFFIYLIKIYPIDNFGSNVVMFGVPAVILSNKANKSTYMLMK